MSEVPRRNIFEYVRDSVLGTFDVSIESLPTRNQIQFLAEPFIKNLRQKLSHEAHVKGETIELCAIQREGFYPSHLLSGLVAEGIHQGILGNPKFKSILFLYTRRNIQEFLWPQAYENNKHNKGKSWEVRQLIVPVSYGTTLWKIHESYVVTPRGLEDTFTFSAEPMMIHYDYGNKTVDH